MVQRDDARLIVRLLEAERYPYRSIVVPSTDPDSGAATVRVYSFAPEEESGLGFEKLIELLSHSGAGTLWSAWCADSGDEEAEIRAAFPKPLESYAGPSTRIEICSFERLSIAGEVRLATDDGVDWVQSEVPPNKVSALEGIVQFVTEARLMVGCEVPDSASDGPDCPDLGVAA